MKESYMKKRPERFHFIKKTKNDVKIYEDRRESRYYLVWGTQTIPIKLRDAHQISDYITRCAD